jgi:hypothetical protein
MLYPRKESTLGVNSQKDGLVRYYGDFYLTILNRGSNQHSEEIFTTILNLLAEDMPLKGLSHEIDLKNFDQNLQNLA